MKLNSRISSKPGKNRKAHYNAPYHKRFKMMSATVAKPLRAELGVKNLPIHSGDEVLILKGKHASTTAKVAKVSRRKMRVTIEGVDRENSASEKKPIWFAPCTLKIVKPHSSA